MAVSIMSARCCRASLLPLCFLLCLLQVLIQGQVFRQAHSVFLRSKRANMFLLEEFLQGNLERECHEELCNFEEAREYFEDLDKTVAFWTVYYDGNQCEPNPCLHGGNCTDKVGGFQCSCPAHHFGPICEQRAVGGVTRRAQWLPTAPQVTTPEIAACPTGGPTACQQLCAAAYDVFTCSCTTGFKLHTDKRSCVPEVDFPCGRLHGNSTTSMCRHGNCPWQVSLMNTEGAELCSGVLLGRRSVLTAAHCLLQGSESDLQPSSFYVTTGNRMPVSVQALYVHSRFRLGRHDNDLALLELAEPVSFGPALIHLCLPTKDFSENILMHPGRTGVAARQWSQELLYLTLDECRDELDATHPLSNKMFCMRTVAVTTAARSGRHSLFQHGVHRKRNSTSVNEHGGRPPLNSLPTENETPSVSDVRSEVSRRPCGSVLAGAPVATVEQGTAFLTGLLISTSSGCHGDSLLFTKLSRYLTWIRPRLEASEERMTPQLSRLPV
ncbi:vitamin K-dependent protein Z-like [Solea senegalensis]|uniref:Vitamin K-dependent protein Z-like n=3 Tax=Solea senegalensis TaxID=28829 RepID=A0AAV6RBM9_SOLSE|nr:vitamin K-dependent protein Z-like [Solea senegalensis]